MLSWSTGLTYSLAGKQYSLQHKSRSLYSSNSSKSKSAFCITFTKSQLVSELIHIRWENQQHSKLKSGCSKNRPPALSMVILPLNAAWIHSLISNRWNEALHGVAVSPGVTFANAGDDYSYATSFPQPILMGAAFDDELIHAVATVISTEARAFNNGNMSGLNFWTPWVYSDFSSVAWKVTLLNDLFANFLLPSRNINPYRDVRIYQAPVPSLLCLDGIDHIADTI